ncbi:MAG: hypothetical protein GY798_34125, partial [Hyphomicrobiales bacterium]|nr:hypothetical protein [Hyphomicrobiales bacterium]
AAAAAAATVPPAHAQSAVPEILSRWAEGWSAVSEPEKLMAVTAEDIVFEDVAVGVVFRGSAALRDLLAEAASAIPDFKVEIFDGFATDTMAAAEYAMSGVQSGNLPYLPGEDRKFRIRGSSVFVLDGGKIKRESRYYDMARFLEALGGMKGLESAFPKLGTPAAKPPEA